MENQILILLAVLVIIMVVVVYFGYRQLQKIDVELKQNRFDIKAMQNAMDAIMQKPPLPPQFTADQVASQIKPNSVVYPDSDADDGVSDEENTEEVSEEEESSDESEYSSDNQSENSDDVLEEASDEEPSINATEEAEDAEDDMLEEETEDEASEEPNIVSLEKVDEEAGEDGEDDEEDDEEEVEINKSKESGVKVIALNSKKTSKPPKESAKSFDEGYEEESGDKTYVVVKDKRGNKRWKQKA